MNVQKIDLRDLQKIEHRHQILRLILFIVFYLGGAYCATRLASTFLIAALPFYLLAAASLHGISLFTHEGVHGVLAGSPAVQRVLSMICAWPVLQNFSAYKVLHLRHHADLGGGKDPDFYSNYTSKPWLEMLMNWGRLLLGYPAYITMIPILAWKYATASERRWITFEISAVLALAILFIFSPIPRTYLIHGWLIPMLIINTMVNIRGMSQHTLLTEPTHPIRGTRTIITNPVTRFFMCNENFHLEHHLYPQIPWYNLPSLHERLKADLLAERAPFIDSYFDFVRQFLLPGKNAS